jgi:hypothetical protein
MVDEDNDVRRSDDFLTLSTPWQVKNSQRLGGVDFFLASAVVSLQRPRHNDFREGRLTSGFPARERATRQSRIVHGHTHGKPRTRRSAIGHADPLYGDLDAQFLVVWSGVTAG